MLKDFSEVKNKAGFTLVELMMVVAVMGLIGLTLTINYFNTQKKVQFVRSYEATLQVLRNARSLAVSSAVGNNQFGEERIGVVIEGGESEVAIEVFVDSGSEAYALDGGDVMLGGTTVDYDYQVVLRDFQVAFSDYGLEFVHPTGLDWPIYIYFEGATGDVSFFNEENVEMVNSLGAEENVIRFKFKSGDGELTKDMMILRISGIAEPLASQGIEEEEE